MTQSSHQKYFVIFPVVGFLVGVPALGISQNGWPNGFYRVSNQASVYKLEAESRAHCQVQNPDQMNLYGGFNQVKIVGNEAFRSGSRFVGQCPWPDGFYRLQNRAEVYGINTDSYCYVSSPELMNAYGGFGRVRVVDSSSNLFALKRNAGNCVWPGR